MMCKRILIFLSILIFTYGLLGVKHAQAKCSAESKPISKSEGHLFGLIGEQPTLEHSENLCSDEIVVSKKAKRDAQSAAKDSIINTTRVLAQTLNCLEFVSDKEDPYTRYKFLILGLNETAEGASETTEGKHLTSEESINNSVQLSYKSCPNEPNVLCFYIPPDVSIQPDAIKKFLTAEGHFISLQESRFIFGKREVCTKKEPTIVITASLPPEIESGITRKSTDDFVALEIGPSLNYPYAPGPMKNIHRKIK